MSHTKRSNAGFTIIELAVVIVMVPIIIALFIYALYAISDNSSNQSIRLALDDAAQFAMDSIESDVRLSAAFNEGIAAPFTDPYGPNNSGAAWSFAGASVNARALILSRIATTQNQSTNIRSPVYIDGAYDCFTQMTLNPTLTYYIIYFVRDQKLYRRTLTDTGPGTTTTLCNGPAGQKQSCPPELSASWNSLCLARDELIASEVSQFSVDYYTLRETTPHSTIYSSPDPDDMNVIDDAEVTLGLTRGSGSSAVTSTQTLRIARLNQL